MAKDIIHSKTKPIKEEKSIPIFGLSPAPAKHKEIRLILTSAAIERLSQWICLKKTREGAYSTRYNVSDNFVQKILRSTDNKFESVTIASYDLGEL